MELTVLLYSKYSPTSNSLLNFINSQDFDFCELTETSLLCIDNENVRKRIQNDKNVSITKVPCILSVNSQGVLDKYEGGDAVDWVSNIVQNIHEEIEQQEREEQEAQRREMEKKEKESNKESSESEKNRLLFQSRHGGSPAATVVVPEEEKTMEVEKPRKAVDIMELAQQMAKEREN